LVGGAGKSQKGNPGDPKGPGKGRANINQKSA